MMCFQLFESHIMLINEIKLILVLNVIHFTKDEPASLLGFNEQNISDLVKENNDELVKEDNFEPDEENNEEGNAELVEENNEEDNAKLVEEISEEDNEYKVDKESVVGPDVSLIDENVKMSMETMTIVSLMAMQQML
ncbi:hypothetical protein Ddye_018869 [Dipteronia dyeriana]|uniref:Uncharacterized protein n=1 Tax=Dipteronia dyeriana TaxID=168575 RepID=A0AAD9TWQ7_9ROSI|nr:hypothetical protein Ddye_018869 [Dipteronia dyeriana]